MPTKNSFHNYKSQIGSKPLLLPTGDYSTKIWKLTAKNPQGVCMIHTVSRGLCQNFECKKYLKLESLVTADRGIAADYARKYESRTTLRYKNLQMEFEALNRSLVNRKSNA